MLVGNWMFNLFFALTAFIIVFTASFGQNLIITTSMRAGIAFILAYLIAYMFRYLLTLASRDSKVHEDEKIDSVNSDTEVDVVDPNLLESNEIDLSEEDIYKASQYVKDLLDDEEV